MTEEEALWQAVGANPADSLPRLVLADWYEERAGKKDCPVCPPDEGDEWHPADLVCAACSGSRRISNGDEETAAALRATADMVPMLHPHRRYSWMLRVHSAPRPHSVDVGVFPALTGWVPADFAAWRDYPTALAAIRDLCAAWVKVNKMEVQS